MGDAPAERRFHALDALRATAMELGLVLHAAVPYTRACPETWAVCDPSRSGAFDLLNTLIHAFRMPVFFVMSGFFAVLLFERAGLHGFVAHRARRIALPLFVACAVIVPVARAVWIYGAFARPGAELPGRFGPSLVAHFQELGLEVFQTIWHLWFLEYLLIFYLGYVIVRGLAARFPGGAGSRLLSAAARRLVSPTRALWISLPTAALMFTMSGWNVDGIGALRPAVHMLVYYGVFFIAGALLFRERERLDSLGRAWRVHFFGAVLLVLPVMMVLARLQGRVEPSMAFWIDGVGRFLSALLTCLLLFGVTGFFVDRFERVRPVQRYLADAAYFVYLSHFPLIALLGIWLAHTSLPAFVKFGLVLAIAVPTLLAIYQLAVRHSAVGRVLHGPR